MTELSIPLDPETAAAYEELDTETKEEWLEFFVGELKRRLHNRRLLDIMDQASTQAAENGLTPEILEEILDGDLVISLQSFNAQQQQQIYEGLNENLRKAIAAQNLKQSMAELSAEVTRNGLTPEILQEILDEQA